MFIPKLQKSMLLLRCSYCMLIFRRLTCRTLCCCSDVHTTATEVFLVVRCLAGPPRAACPRPSWRPSVGSSSPARTRPRPVRESRGWMIRRPWRIVWKTSRSVYLRALSDMDVVYKEIVTLELYLPLSTLL